MIVAVSSLGKLAVQLAELVSVCNRIAGTGALACWEKEVSSPEVSLLAC